MNKILLVIPLALLVAPSFATDKPASTSPDAMEHSQAQALKVSKIASAVMAIRLQCCFTEGDWCSCAPAPNPNCYFYPYRQCEIQQPEKVDDMDKFAKDIVRSGRAKKASLAKK